MKYQLDKNNNSKKLIIGVSILFCTIILIIGFTTAYFTQSGIGDIGNIIATNTNGTIGYTDNKDYMRNNLIPVIDTDVVKFAMKNSLNGYTDDQICKYDGEYNACSLYEFTITNNANVTQELLVSMSPTLNQYGNLYFIVFEGNRTSLTTNSKIVHYSTHIEQDTINFNDLNLKLEPSTSKTYTIVFYIKSLNIDQTDVDSGKTYAATINVNSVTTGDYLSISVGEGCYDSVRLDDGTYKLTKFNGIDEDGNPIEGCGVTKEGEYYSVIVPSEYGGQNISTLGNTMFLPVDLEKFDVNDLSSLKLNKNSYIKELTINEGITTIEDGFWFNAGELGDLLLGTFATAGYNTFAKQVIVEEGVKFNLPNSLKYIGDNAFIEAYIKEIDLPNNLEYIGNNSFRGIEMLSEISIPSTVKIIGINAFYLNNNLTSLTFEGAVEGTSQLTTIGDSAFYLNNISILEIPSSVQTIGTYAFANNDNLTNLTFEGATDGTSQLKTIGKGAFHIYDNGKLTSIIIPASVETIDDSAFSRLIALNSVTFVGATDGTSQLKTIGKGAFGLCDIRTLVIPSSVQIIGSRAFANNDNLTNLTFEGATDGTSQLTTIEDSAFRGCYLTYTDPNNPLIIPSSVTAIGKGTFESINEGDWFYNQNLKYIKFNGTLTAANTDWYTSIENGGVTTLVS